MENSPKREKLLCPNCSKVFIPEAFHIEKLIMDTFDTSQGVHIKNEREVLNKFEIKPSTLIRKAWVTNCPQCNYILRFTAEVAKKELKEIEGRKISSFSEFGTNYFYNLYNYSKPNMDFTDYYNEMITDIKTEINKAIENLGINEWGSLCRGFLTEKTIDNFKFLIRFYANLEEYCNSSIENYKDKNMHQKIKECNFPKELEDLLDQTRDLRNKMVHDGYDLNQDDVDLITNGFLSFLYYLVSTELGKLELRTRVESIDYDFINKKSLLIEIRSFLHNDLGEMIKFLGYYDKFLMPLLDELEIPKYER